MSVEKERFTVGEATEDSLTICFKIAQLFEGKFEA